MTMPEDICTLYLPEHATMVLQGLQTLRQEGLGCDVELQTDAGSIHAHSLVLAVCSPYLKQRLTISSVLYLEGVCIDTLTCIVDHLYTGTMPVPRTNLTQILQLCELLQLHETLRLCKQYRHGNIESGDKQYRHTDNNANVEKVQTPAKHINDAEKETKEKGTKELDDGYSEAEATSCRNLRKRKKPMKTITKVDFKDIDSNEHELNVSAVKIPKLYLAIKKRVRGRVKLLNNERIADEKTRETVESKTGKVVDTKNIRKRKGEGRKHSVMVNPIHGASSKEVKTAENEKKKSLSTNIDTEPAADTHSENERSISKSRSVVKVKSGIGQHNKLGEGCNKVGDGCKKLEGDRNKLGDGRKKLEGDRNKLGDGGAAADPAVTETDTPADVNERQKQTTLDADIETVNTERDDNTKVNKMKKSVYPKKCRICNLLLMNYKRFVEHMKSHTLVKGSDVKEQTKNDLPKHDLPPSESRKARQEHWPCTVCGRLLTSAVRQACHQFSKHDIPYNQNLKLHVCPEEGCKYITASKHYLQIHTQGRHGNERPHVCEFCGKGFKLPSALTTHVNIHTKEKKFECEDCDQTFNQKGGLDLHVRKHHKGQASWTELCHLCSEKFLQKTELCWHMYTAHQIPVPDRYKVFSCHLCNYETIYKNKLERHMDAHDDKRSWVCNECGKKFVTKSYLNRHVRYHGEKSFVCEFEGCNYACVDQNGLNKHIHRMHTHKNFKPFHCSICAYKTGLRGNLDKHIRTVHKLEVVTKHTVHLKMKFKDRQSGDIITKDGQLIDEMLDKGMEERQEEEGFPDPGYHGKQAGTMGGKEDTEYIAEEIDKKMAEHMVSLGQVGASLSTGADDPSHSSGGQLPIGYLCNTGSSFVGLYASSQHSMLGSSDPRLATGLSDSRLATGPSDPRLATGPSDPTLATGPSDPRLVTGPSDPTLATGPSDPRLVTLATQVTPQSEMYLTIDPTKFQEYY